MVFQALNKAMQNPQAHQFYVSFTSAEVKGHKVKMRAVEDVFVSFGLGGPGPDFPDFPGLFESRERFVEGIKGRLKKVFVFLPANEEIYIYMDVSI